MRRLKCELGPTTGMARGAAGRGGAHGGAWRRAVGVPGWAGGGDAGARVNRTVGNRSGLTGGSVRYETGQNSKFKFEFKKMKNSQKISKNTSRCDESNGVKFSQKFIHLV